MNIRRLAILALAVSVAACSDSSPTEPNKPPPLPTLSVSVSASPTSGLAPLSSTITATVSGTATGAIHYYVDCNGDGFWEQDESSSNASLSYSCTYTNAGTFTAKVTVERDSLNATSVATVIVTRPTLVVSLAASPDSGEAPLWNVALTATVSGTATGDITYHFVCDTASNATSLDTTSAASALTSEGTCSYANGGTYTPRVAVDRDGVSAEATATVTVIPPPGARAYSDRPDDFTGAQFHVMYIIPSDGVDSARDTNGELENSIGSIQNWFKGQSGGGSLRIDTYQGRVDITFARLEKTEAEVDAELDNQDAVFYDFLDSAGYLKADPDKHYIIYYDGMADPQVGCGRGGGSLATLFIKGADCTYGVTMVQSPNDSPLYWEYGFGHEALHTLGIVSPAAPHYALGHACDYADDLMSGAGCATIWNNFPLVLDYNHDDYYNPNGLPDGVVNLYDSPFWNKGP